MSENLKHLVLPHETRPQPIPDINTASLTDSERKDAKGLDRAAGCAIWGVIGIVFGVASGSAIGGIVIASIVVALMAFTIKSGNVSKLAREKAEQARRSIEYANQSEAKRVENEAASLTSTLAGIYGSSTKLATNLPHHLSQASQWLQQAEIEYKDNAFSPFWDAVENAARNLADFNGKANQLSKNAVEYYRRLNGRKHTFPTFPARMGTVADASSELNQLRQVVRMGQTNFQFANIWEHRRTREVLITGFRTLGEAVNNLGTTIEYSISNLEQSISSDVAKLVEQEIKTREVVDRRMLEQNRMLDNIQTHRKPDITDHPSRY